MAENSVIKYDDYDFYEGLDLYGYDIGYFSDKSVAELKEIADNDDNCICFNTLGYLKYNIKPIDHLIRLYTGPKGSGLYVKKMHDRINSKIDMLTKKKNNEIVNNLTFTVTTCKRWNTFKQTIDMLLIQCKDIEIIDRWLCVDDNSSDTDRKLMQETYPFFDFIFKGPETKGHAKSMNMIWSNVVTDYVVHFEDDWACNKPFRLKPYLDYIKENIDSLDHIILRKICWGDHDFITELDNNIMYKYVYNPNHYIKPALNVQYDLNKKYNYNAIHNDRTKYWWWPGFSLNPSMFNLASIKNRVGYFNERMMSELFEYDYASRCFIGGINVSYVDLDIEHIGEISSYSLNDTRRYYDK